MTVTYCILETRRLTDEALLGYVKADFSFSAAADDPNTSRHRGQTLSGRLAHYVLPSVKELSEVGDHPFDPGHHEH